MVVFVGVSNLRYLIVNCDSYKLEAENYYRKQAYNKFHKLKHHIFSAFATTNEFKNSYV